MVACRRCGALPGSRAEPQQGGQTSRRLARGPSRSRVTGVSLLPWSLTEHSLPLRSCWGSSLGHQGSQGPRVELRTAVDTHTDGGPPCRPRGFLGGGVRCVSSCGIPHPAPCVDCFTQKPQAGSRERSRTRVCWWTPGPSGRRGGAGGEERLWFTRPGGWVRTPRGRGAGDVPGRTLRLRPRPFLESLCSGLLLEL